PPPPSDPPSACPAQLPAGTKNRATLRRCVATTDPGPATHPPAAPRLAPPPPRTVIAPASPARRTAPAAATPLPPPPDLDPHRSPVHLRRPPGSPHCAHHLRPSHRNTTRLAPAADTPAPPAPARVRDTPTTLPRSSQPC